MAYGNANAFSDFLGGFMGKSDEIRKINQAQAEKDREREDKALTLLANADDPGIRASAVTAMLTPRKEGSAPGLFGKWFSQQSEHPAYSQIQQIIGEKSPFLSMQERTSQQTSGQVTGRVSGANQAYSDITGENLPDEDIRRAALGAVGAPPPRQLGMKAGNLTFKDGTTAGGFASPDGSYYDDDGNWRDDVVSFNTTAGRTGSTTAGAKWVQQRDGSWVHVDAAGKPLTAANVPGAPPQGPPAALFPNTAAGGIGAVDPRSLKVTPVIPGTESMGRPEDPQNAFSSLKQISDSVQARAKATTPNFGGLGADPAEMQGALDREAQVAGYSTWAELQAALTKAQQAISGRVAPSPAPPAGGPPPGPIQGPGPAGGRGARPPQKPGGQGAGMQLDMDKVLAALAVLNKQ